MSDPARAGVLDRSWLATLLKHGLVTGLACWGLWVQMAYRLPSRLALLLIPWVGFAATALGAVLVVDHALDVVAEAGPIRQVIRRLEWWVSLVLRVFIYGSLLVFANGMLDRDPGVERASEVRGVHAVRAPLGGVLPYGWISVRSWNTPEGTLRFLLQPQERTAFWEGEPVVAQVRRGALRIPWVGRLVEDRERRNQAILALAPQAALAWQDLVWFDLEHERWAEAVEATHRYHAIYPADLLFVKRVADELDNAEQPAQEVRLLEAIVPSAPPDGLLLKLYGLALSRAGRKTAGAEWLRKAIALQPQDFWGYYHLGHTLRDLGQVTEAIEAYESAQRLRPGYPEVESDLALLRRAVPRKASP